MGILDEMMPHPIPLDHPTPSTITHVIFVCYSAYDVKFSPHSEVLRFRVFIQHPIRAGPVHLCSKPRLEDQGKHNDRVFLADRVSREVRLPQSDISASSFHSLNSIQISVSFSLCVCEATQLNSLVELLITAAIEDDQSNPDADKPPGCRHGWLVETSDAVTAYLHQCSEQEQKILTYVTVLLSSVA